MLSLANVLLRRASLIIGLAAVGMVFAIGYALLRPRDYTASALFAPQTRNTSAGLSGLAAQIGLAVPTGGEGSASPQFYVDLLYTQPILKAVARSRYTPTGSGGSPVTLVDLYGDGESTPALREERAIKKLREHIGTSLSPKTGVVTLLVSARHPQLASQIATRLLELLNQFNLESRQSRATAERKFTERRMNEVRGELNVAEARLQDFLQRNRDYRNSPALQFEHDRLQQALAVQQTLFTSLTQAVEQAKIEEVRDTPVLTVIAQPEAPVRPDSRGVLMKAVLGLVGGLTLGILIALAREIMHHSRERSGPEYAEFMSLRRAAFGDIVRPWRPLGRLLGARRNG